MVNRFIFKGGECRGMCLWLLSRFLCSVSRVRNHCMALAWLLQWLCCVVLITKQNVVESKVPFFTIIGESEHNVNHIITLTHFSEARHH